jgi:hypothetical protein
MKQKGNTKLLVTIIVIILFAIVAYFAYKIYFPELQNVLPNSEQGVQIQPENTPIISEPKAGSKIVSPFTIRGTVPPGWMFEGTFPIKLLDANRKLIVQAAALEEVPGSWQSNVPVYFTAKITFSTTAKSGFLILQNDNPSGDPANSKTFEIPVNF